MSAAEVFIREMTTDDLPEVLDIYNDIILTTTAVYSEQPHTLEMRTAWYNERKAAGFPLMVAEHTGRVVGFATYGSFRAWPCYRYTVEHSIYVHKESRGLGISKLLLQQLIELAKQAGMHALIAGIDSENEISLHLHRRFGFEQAGYFKEVGYKFDRWLDLIFMELILHSHS
ncbi:GNAT family N-acetyltransferase [Mucilaginibacter koreensis]